MSNKQFSKKEAVKFGWHTWKANIFFFLTVLLTTWIISSAPDALKALWGEGTVIDSLIHLAAWILSTIVSIGTTKIALEFAKNNKPDFNELFSNYKLFFKYFFATILYALIVSVGLVLLVVPGIIWAVKFVYYPYFIVDKGVGPIESLKRSSQLTKGAKGRLLLFLLILAGINILGLLALVVGLLVTVPLSMVAMAFVYYKLLSQTDLPAQAGDPDVLAPSTIVSETHLAASTNS